MWYYLKKSFFPFIYLLFMAVIAFGILCLNENLKWLKIILLILNLALYVFIISAIYYKEGQDGIKVRHANDIERREIIRTGANRPLKLKEEYKSYKGFLMGIGCILPLVVLLTIHTIIFACGGDTRVFGGICSIIYFIIFAFFNIGITELSMGAYYYTLLAIPFMLLVTGIPYIIGGEKMQIQYDKIEEKQRSIYGDKK